MKLKYYLYFLMYVVFLVVLGLAQMAFFGHFNEFNLHIAFYYIIPSVATLGYLGVMTYLQYRFDHKLITKDDLHKLNQKLGAHVILTSIILSIVAIITDKSTTLVAKYLGMTAFILAIYLSVLRALSMLKDSSHR